MFHQFRKYRNFFAIGFMAFYLAGGLQFSVLECLHFLSHIDDMVEGKYSKHHFHSHNGSHHHTALIALDAQSDNSNQDSLPVNDSSDSFTKKSPQIFYVNQTGFKFLQKKSASAFEVGLSLNSTFPSVPVPPPRA